MRVFAKYRDWKGLRGGVKRKEGGSEGEVRKTQHSLRPPVVYHASVDEEWEGMRDM